MGEIGHHPFRGAAPGEPRKIGTGASDTAAERATFILDPEGVPRAMVYWPMSACRSADEIYRLLLTLQTADENAGTMPENRTPGQPVIVPAPKTPQATRCVPPKDMIPWNDIFRPACCDIGRSAGTL